MINSALVSYSLPAPYCRRLMLRQAVGACCLSLARSDIVTAYFCARVSAYCLGLAPPRAWGSALRYSAPTHHAPPFALAPPLFRRGAGGRAFAGSRPSAFVALRRAGGRSQARIRAHPTLYKVIVHCLGFAVRRAPFGVLHSAQLGAVARSLAPLPLLARAPLRFSSGSPTRSARRLENGAGILSADFVSVSALPLVAPLRVSLYWHFFCIIDHSALFGGVALPLAQSVAPFLRSDPSECPAPPVK